MRRTIAEPTITTTYGFLNAAEVSARFATDASPDEIGARVQETMRRRRYRVHPQRPAQLRLRQIVP